jgi:Mlc titration factor MtfA (ptsG expression regulator)
VFGLGTVRAYLTARRRRKTVARAFPAWCEVDLRRTVRHDDRLDRGEKARLRDVVKVLLDEKEWRGAGGMHVNAEVMTVIAAQAALPLLYADPADHDYYPGVARVVVHPQAFFRPNPAFDWEDDGGDGSGARHEGMAADDGTVVLSWKAVLEHAAAPARGRNVVIHEFAHQLDYENGHLDGVPYFADNPDGFPVKMWMRALEADRLEHKGRLVGGGPTLLDARAAESAAEFFAHAAELFFCRPAELFSWHPDFYAVLVNYFKNDPRKWFAYGRGET